MPKFGVGLDGSRVCFRALKVVLPLVHKHGDEVFGLHIAKPDGQGSKLVRANAEGETVGTEGRLHWQWVQKAKQKGDDKTIDELVSLARETEIDVVAVGAYGRKGEQLEEMGSVAHGALRASGMHSIIVKNSSPIPEEGNPISFCFTTDLSAYSLKAFQTFLPFTKPSDKITVVHTRATSIGALQRADFEKAAKGLGIEFAWQEIECKTSIPDALCEAAEACDAHFVVMGYAGHTMNKKDLAVELGSVTQRVKQQARQSVFVVKVKA